MSSLLTDTQRASVEASLQNVFDTFKRPFTLYIDALTAVISTDPTYSRFGQHDQNVFNPPVTPQAYTLTGCIMYGEKQPYAYFSPEGRTNPEQLKLRDSQGTVRIKVDATGYELMKNCKIISLDGFQFNLNSNARPHGFPTPTRYTFTAEKSD